MNSTTADTSLAAAERRYRKVNGWFWLFVAMMPLGAVLPCVVSMIAYRLWGDRVSAPIGLSALLWPIVGVAGALLLRGVRARARRSLGLARLAQSFGLKFTDVPASEKFAFLKSVSFMENPHYQSARNLLEGQTGSWPWIALDYEYTYSWGSVSEVGAQTILAFLAGFERLPPFAVIPIGMMGRLENYLLGNRTPIQTATSAQFNKRFAVVGEDANAIQSCLTQALLEVFLADALLTVIVEGGRLLVFRRLTYVRAEEYQAFLAQAHRVAELLSAPS
jgi:hypothetical protein